MGQGRFELARGPRLKLVLAGSLLSLFIIALMCYKITYIDLDALKICKHYTLQYPVATSHQNTGIVNQKYTQ